MTPDHADYNPYPVGFYRTYCPACCRQVRCGDIDGRPTFYRHWIDPQNPRGYRDRCVNSRRAVADAHFLNDDLLIVNRATYELAKGPR